MEELITQARSYLKSLLDDLLKDSFDGQPNDKFRRLVEETERNFLSDPGHYFDVYNNLNNQQKTFLRKEIGRFIEMYLISNE